MQATDPVDPQVRPVARSVIAGVQFRPARANRVPAVLEPGGRRFSQGRCLCPAIKATALNGCLLRDRPDAGDASQHLADEVACRRGDRLDGDRFEELGEQMTSATRMRRIQSITF